MKLTNKGFTLVEMLIVIVIIGILAAAIFPRLTGIQARARDTARVSDVKQIATALETWNLDEGKYYTDNKITNNMDWKNADSMLDAFVSQNYLKTKPKDPQDYPYAYSTNDKIYAIGGYSEGAKKNANWGLSSMTNTDIAGTAVITTDATPQSINKDTLCKSVTKGSSDNFTNKAACTSSNPINVIVN